MTPLLPAIDWGSMMGVVVWWLAFGVGALVGGFLVGLIAQGLTALLSNKKVPLVALWPIRILAGIACGWLLALILSGRGPGGVGGAGGWWGAADGSQNQGHASSTAPTNANRTSPTSPLNTTPTTPAEGDKSAEQVIIEVLDGTFAASLLNIPDTVDPDRCYRVSPGAQKGGTTNHANGVLMDLGGLSQQIKNQTDPPVRVVEVIIYRDSPARDSKRPEALYNTLRMMRNSRGEKIEMKVVYSPGNTPMK